MGNNPSHQRSTRPDANPTASTAHRGRSPSPVPVPGHPHPSMRTHRRSLELPDFNRAGLSATSNGAAVAPIGIRGRQKSPPKTQAINIPRPAGDVPPPKRWNNNFSSSELIVPATHLPFPPTQTNAAQRTASTYGGGGVRVPRSRGSRFRRMQHPQGEPPPQEQEPQQEPSTPPSPSSFKREIVNSSIPIGLMSVVDEQLLEEEEPAAQLQVDESTLVEPIALEITWRGGGKEVILARAGDDDWNGRQFMERLDPDSNTWTTTVYLLPGTHHIRFLVDDQWRVSDEFPTAVDDQGSLANYVNVQPGSPPPQTSPVPPPATPSPSPAQPPQNQSKPPIPSHSFWSTTSSVEEDSARDNQKQTSSSSAQAKWSSTLPSALIEAAKEEEAYLTASAGHYDAQSRSTHVSGFVPAPNIPPAPGMPRHLDKLILNTRMTVPGSGNATGNGGSSGTGSPARQAGQTGLGGRVGSGQGGGRERDRERRERDRGKREGRERKSRREKEESHREKKERRERDRELERKHEQEVPKTGKGESRNSRRDSGADANFPPAPPPSEDESGAGLDEKPETSPLRGASGDTVDTGSTSPGENTADSTTTTTTATTSATTVAAQAEGRTVPEKSTCTTTITQTTTTPNPTPVISVTRPSDSATIPATTVTNTSSAPSPTQPPPPTAAAGARALPAGGVSGSRAITLDMENMPALSDDNSVLPVPSYVVLQHLCTSAIRNGVLGVASTTRYRKKYMTTVYYKPAA